jgi:hypothetical protein
VYNKGMLLLRRLCTTAAFAAALTACGLSPGAGEGEGEGEEAETDDEFGDSECDGGPCTDAPKDRDCGQLVLTTCGSLDECREDPGCVAASLLAEFRPDDCLLARDDVRSYPPCAASSCEELVSRVCGVDDACASASGCAPARTLFERSEAGDSTAATSCAQALTDQTLFPLCSQS